VGCALAKSMVVLICAVLVSAFGIEMLSKYIDRCEIEFRLAIWSTCWHPVKPLFSAGFGGEHVAAGVDAGSD